jgi:hypothetical protein
MLRPEIAFAMDQGAAIAAPFFSGAGTASALRQTGRR